MKTIYMYILPQKSPILRQTENDHAVEISKEFADNPVERTSILNFYQSLGKTFEEKVKKIQEHEKDATISKQPYFWDSPSVKFVLREEDEEGNEIK